MIVLDWASHLEALFEQPFIAEWFTSLARLARVLCLGTRGVGMSGPLAEGSPIESWMQGLVTVMHAAGFERASLVPHGLGAQMALMAAAQHPERWTRWSSSTGTRGSHGPTTTPPGFRIVPGTWALYAVSG